ncbi:uncharacterized protein MELLADRAFT_102928 [Melampsora larici-populina 98AG31]|uniref:Uncharacterized protein n=1 Tax=Melampsora larici-populina (strain 98AG31 / pathotype 3-4-7) TaxID=747676 RepID=F4R8M2_MELLP|nr:uncharacterized protein MELLADRAFT_102928 [Melampsora larici-populina 98AG31]EGG11044.1 hypothetical protein MELLADRAFT_102928 [Melampsora larici-populina 98AG31]
MFQGAVIWKCLFEGGSCYPEVDVAGHLLIPYSRRTPLQQNLYCSKLKDFFTYPVAMMFPPILGRVTSGILPGLEAIACHDRKPDPNAIPGGGSTSLERERNFDVYFKNNLEPGSFHKIPDYLVQHVQRHGFLNSHEIEHLISSMVYLEEATDDIRQDYCEARIMLRYIYTMLRSEDPEVIAHREILKRQEKESRKRYKRYKRMVREYQDDTGLLWALIAQEIKRTCDVEDAAAANRMEPDAAAPPYTHTP